MEKVITEPTIPLTTEPTKTRSQVERWEELALEGMLKALSKQVQGRTSPSSAGLSRHLEKLLEKRLPNRLEKLAATAAKVDQADRKTLAAKPKKAAGN